jgi:hypothetical protein
LWAVLEADIGAFWETYEAAKTSTDGKLATDQEGKMLTVRKQRAKLINDLPPEFRKLIEDVSIDRNGNVIPKLYSKDRANRGLREMLNIGRTDDRPEPDVSQLSDAELIQQLADTAKELGIDINLNYSFAQPPATEGPSVVDVETVAADVTDPVSVPAADAADDAAAADAARESAALGLCIFGFGTWAHKRVDAD